MNSAKLGKKIFLCAATILVLLASALAAVSSGSAAKATRFPWDFEIAQQLLETLS